VTLPDHGNPASPEHPVDSFLHVLRGLGMDVPAVAPYDLAVPDDAVRGALCALRGRGIAPPFAVIHPVASDEPKNWPVERFAAVADHLVRAHHLDVLVTGSDRDGDRLGALLGNVSCRERVVAAAGAFSLPEMAAVCRSAEIMVTADTGPMHLADTVGTPLVALFLPWNAVNRPYRQPDAVVLPPGLPATAAFNAKPADADTARYIDRIAVEQVLERVEGKLRARGTARPVPSPSSAGGRP
jgi:ADP-heptose:LPS heptosyltransferase